MNNSDDRLILRIISVVTMSLFLLSGGCGSSDGTLSGKAVKVEDTHVNLTAYDTVKIYSLGDSITTGFSTRGVLQDAPEENWSTGNARNDLNSHYQRLLDIFNNTDIDVFRENLAVKNQEVISNSTESLNGQADDLQQILSSDQFNYVTILMGFNDVCRTNLDVQSFKSEFRSAVSDAIDRIIIDSNLIFIASIPNIQVILNNPTCPIQGPPLNLWIEANCPNANLPNDGVLEYIQAANDAYKEIAAENPKKVIFDEETVFKADIQPNMISELDCFHPSVNGQAFLATETWSFIGPKLKEKFQ